MGVWGAQPPRSQRHYKNSIPMELSADYIFFWNFEWTQVIFFSNFWGQIIFLNPLMSQVIFFLHIQRQGFFFDKYTRPPPHPPRISNGRSLRSVGQRYRGSLKHKQRHTTITGPLWGYNVLKFRTGHMCVKSGFWNFRILQHAHNIKTVYCKTPILFSPY